MTTEPSSIAVPVRWAFLEVSLAPTVGPEDLDRFTAHLWGHYLAAMTWAREAVPGGEGMDVVHPDLTALPEQSTHDASAHQCMGRKSLTREVV